MENLPSIDEILSNQYFQVGMIVWVVFFSGCITRMVPDNLRRLLDHPVVRVGVLALVVYLAEKDFKLAVIVAAGFFLSTAPLNIKESMTSSSSNCDGNDTQATCETNTHCKWDGTSNKCITKGCGLDKTLVGTDILTGCGDNDNLTDNPEVCTYLSTGVTNFYSGSKCLKNCNGTNSTTCTANGAHCEYVDSNCRIKCDEIPTEDLCIDDDNKPYKNYCEYNGNNQKCQNNCSLGNNNKDKCQALNCGYNESTGKCS